MNHHDPDRAEFGYEPTDDWGRAYKAMNRAASRLDSEARYLADSFVAGEIDDDWSREHHARIYRQSVAAEQYACAVWQQVIDERAAA